MGLALTRDDIAIEANCNNPEKSKLQKRQETVAYLGNLAIRAEQLGLNDELTPIFNYLNEGESSLTLTRRNAETKMAEYLKKTHFKTNVDFYCSGDDLISKIDKVPMKKMLLNNLDVIKSNYEQGRLPLRELQRAQIEKDELEKISSWRVSAPIGAFLIFESLPIKEEEDFAVSRIFQKTSENELKSCFLSLYNGSIDQFNNFRKEISPGTKDETDEISILDNCHSFYDENIKSLDDFSKYYVGIYDHLLGEKDGKEYNFGLENNGENKMENGLSRVQKVPRIVSIYINAIRDLACSGGKVTQEIIDTNNKLKKIKPDEKSEIENDLKIGQTISADLARKIMKDIISKLSCVIDKADGKLLKDLEDPETDEKVVYQTIVHMNTQASLAGITYASNGCGEMSRSEASANNPEGSEADGIAEAYRIDKTGRLHIDFCRIEGCPSLGIDEENHVKKRTLVGGCNVCMECQKYYDDEKDPVKIYKAAKEKAIWDKYIEELLERAISKKPDPKKVT